MIIYSLVALPLILAYVAMKNWQDMTYWALVLSLISGIVGYIAVFFINILLFSSPYNNIFKATLYFILIYFYLPSLVMFFIYRLLLKLETLQHGVVTYPVFVLGFFTVYMLPHALFYNRTYGIEDLFYLPTLYIVLSHYYISFPKINNKKAIMIRALIVSVAASIPVLICYMNHLLYSAIALGIVIVWFEIVYIQHTSRNYRKSREK